MLAGVVALAVASGLLGLLTLSAAIPLVLVLTAMMGLPYSVVSISSNQGMFISARHRTGAWRRGSIQTCRYFGAISATVMIGIFYGTGVNPGNWGRMVVVMLVLSVVAFGLALFWRQPKGTG